MSDNKKKPAILFTRKSPYRIENLRNFINSLNEKISVRDEMYLCRCGNSRKKPFCDGSHAAQGLLEEKLPDRVADNRKSYSGEGITVHFNGGICSHDGACLRRLPVVFNLDRRPWINTAGASPEEIMETIRRCPSGALSFTFNGVHHINFDREPSLKVAKNGPLKIIGWIKLKDDQDTIPDSEEHYTLCPAAAHTTNPFVTALIFITALRIRIIDDIIITIIYLPFTQYRTYIRNRPEYL